jgi:thiol-disulfide isomerase/thioredoxin
MNKLLKEWNKTTKPMKILFFVLLAVLMYMFFFKTVPFSESFGNPVSCTYYYMEECGHCKRFNPEWNTLVQTYTGPVKLRKVSATEAGDDLKKYNITGFPTILIIDDKGNYEDYTGPRTSQALIKFLNKE